MATKTIERTIGVLTYKKSEYWVAFCPELKIFGYSTTSREEAETDFEDALRTFLEVHHKLGTIFKALINLGWLKEDDSFIPPRYFNASGLTKNYGSSAQRINKIVNLPVC